MLVFLSSVPTATAAKPRLTVQASARSVDPGGTLSLAVHGATSACTVEVRHDAPRARAGYRARLRGATLTIAVPATAKPGVYVATVTCGASRRASTTYRVHNPNGPDFSLALRTIAPADGKRAPRTRRFAVSATNLAPWSARTSRLCVTIRGADAKIAAVGFPGSRKTTTSACSVVPWIMGGAARGFEVDVKGKRAVKVAATITAGNAKGQSKTWSSSGTRARARARAHQATAIPRQSLATSCASAGKLGLAFVADDSGSMRDNDPSTLRGQAISVGLDQLPDGSLAGATRFADASAELFSASDVNGGTRGSLKSQATGFDSSGGTDYQLAFEGAAAQLAQMGAADKRAVIFLSDGLPNSEDFTSDQPIAGAGTPIFTVGFGTADPKVLADIAARSGGQTFTAQSAADLQAIFARIVAILTCAAPSVTTTAELDPGVTRTIPFTVGWDDGEFRSLAAWSGGKVAVTAIRPDGSTMSPAALRRGEAFSDNPTYALLTGTDPAAGGWQLSITADKSNVSTVHVSIDVFKKGLPALPPPPPLNQATDGRWRDPCAVYDGGTSTTKKVFGGTERDFDRMASLYTVCGGFGFPEDLQLTLGMKCAVISAAAVVAGGELADPALKTFEQVCSATDTLQQLASGEWAGVAGGLACSAFGSLFSEAAGIIAAGATAETGPGAALVGTAVYRAFAAGFKLACGAVFSGGAQSLANKLEADHETHVARDVLTKKKCLRFTQRFNYTADWSAEDCPSAGGGGGGGGW
jgi:hypothetical protein